MEKDLPKGCLSAWLSSPSTANPEQARQTPSHTRLAHSTRSAFTRAKATRLVLWQAGGGEHFARGVSLAQPNPAEAAWRVPGFVRLANPETGGGNPRPGAGLRGRRGGECQPAWGFFKSGATLSVPEAPSPSSRERGRGWQPACKRAAKPGDAAFRAQRIQPLPTGYPLFSPH